jgi:hypothetical protein
MPGTGNPIWTLTSAAFAGLLIAPADNMAAATSRRFCKVRGTLFMLKFLWKAAEIDRPLRASKVSSLARTVMSRDRESLWLNDDEA